MATLEGFLLFVVIPVGAFGVGAVAAVAAYSDVRARMPTERTASAEGPGPVARFVLLPSLLLTTVVFGVILWTLHLSVAADIDAGSGPEAPALARLHLWSGIMFAGTACVTIGSEAWVMRRRMRQILGEEYARVMALVVIPETLSMFALVLNFLLLGLLRDIVDASFPLSAAGIDATVLGFQAFAASTLATPVAITFSNRIDGLSDLRAFIRALLPMEAGVAVTIAALALAFLQLGSLAV